MNVIRDINDCGIIMIPAFTQYGVTRCNIVECKEKPTTICIHEQATFGMCEKHYQDAKIKGEVKLKLEFD